MANDRVDFTRGAAERIARVVRIVEQGDRNQSGPTWRRVDSGGGGGGGVRAGKVADAWAIGTCATVTIWERAGANCAPTEKTPTKTVEGVLNLSHDVQGGSRVVIGQAADGKWYLVEAGSPDPTTEDPPSTCRSTIGGEDVTTILGWDGTKEQLLGHDANGCLKWFDVEQCSTG